MEEIRADDTTPLLEDRGCKSKPKLPVKQLAILGICRLCEPICLTSIFSYLPQMIRSFGVAEADIGFWAGLISASFAAAQFLTGLAWARLSDRIGRKPTILFGLLAMLACVVLFGFSTSLHMAMIARCCVGLLNGNVGILRTVVAELVPEKELQPQAFGILPLAWNIGSIIGPAIGGFLSEPAQKYPEVFPKWSFFDRNPWALPNLFIATISLVGFCLGILFLEETLAERKYRYDPGREIGRRIEQFFGFKSESPIARPQLDAHDRDRSPDAPLTWSQILTKSSVQLIMLYVTLAIHNISYEQLLSVFLATKIHPNSNPIRLPFHLPGGFALDTSDIGLVFASIGVVVITVQFVFYPPLAKKYGKIRLLTVAAILDPIAYNAIPYTLALYKPYTADGSNWTLWVTWAAIIIMRGTTTVFALTSCVILITNTASSPKALGTLNGLSTSLAALGLSLGPSTFGCLFSTGQKSSWTTIPWVGLSLVALSMWVWIPDAEDLERDDKKTISQHSSNSDREDQISARG